MRFLRDIYSFWLETWRQSKIMFFTETACSLMGMIGNGMLNFSPFHPNMLVVLSLFCISAIGLAITSYIRQASWMFVLMSFYATVSFIGITKLLLHLG